MGSFSWVSWVSSKCARSIAILSDGDFDLFLLCALPQIVVGFSVWPKDAKDVKKPTVDK